MGNATASLSSLGQASLRSLIQQHSTLSNESGPDGRNGGSVSSLAERSRAAAAWDPSYEREDIDWYSEYVDRHGPVSFNWLQQPSTKGDGDVRKQAKEVKGIGLLRDWSSRGEDRVMGPLEDGSVCVWDLNHSYSAGSQSTKGRILGVSAPGILTASASEEATPEFLNLGECVSVDSVRQRAYLAVGNVLNEVDLETLQVVTQQRYPCPVFALSQETDYSAPLTLATSQDLYIHDPRLSTSTSMGTDATYASLFEPNPLYVLHPPAPHEHTILIAGRFHSIFHYDRRFFPRLQSVVHSGGSLCSLASAPSPRFPINSDRLGPDSHKIVACGEYNGRGSLELYHLTQSSQSHINGLSGNPPNISPAAYKNRQSAARSKLLSVASHGARLVYSDADGNVKWVERDGRSEVRRWNINTHLSDMRASQRTANYGAEAGLELDEDESDTNGLFANSRGNNEVVRKVLPTGGSLMSDELLIWTGERIGRIRFSGAVEPGHDEEDEGDISIDEELDSSTREEVRRERREQLRREQEYARTMRKALERQADEVRRMGGFGL